MDEDNTFDENKCPHCDGTGIFVSCGGTPDETEMPCICMMDSDEYPSSLDDEEDQDI